MEFNWIGKKKDYCNARGGGNADYEVMVSVTLNNKRGSHPKEEWEMHRMNITFSTLAFEFLKDGGYTHVKRTPIAPNSDREWLLFIKENESSNGGIKLSLSKSKKQYIASFSFDNKSEYSVVKSEWQKVYSLKYDEREKHYYIDGADPIIEKRRWI